MNETNVNIIIHFIDYLHRGETTNLANEIRFKHKKYYIDAYIYIYILMETTK